jgi:hypothetical protein
MRLQMLQDQQSSGNQYQSSANMASRGRGNRGRGRNRGRGGRGCGFGGRNPTGTSTGDRPLPSQSVKFVTNLAILLLSAGTDLRRIISLTAKVQGTCHQGMAWTQIGMWTAELLITLPESLTS